MWNYSTSVKYPEIGLYQELVEYDNVDLENEYLSAVKFNFRFSKDDNGEIYIVDGLRSTSQSFNIEVPYNIKYKTDDKITIGDKTYKIKNVVIAISNETLYNNQSRAWVNHSSNSNRKAILTLR